MKRSILLFAAVLFLSLTAAYAQQRDTTDVSQQDPAKDMVQITSRDLPAAVKETLQSSAYAGWEQAEIFRSEKSDRYLVRINDGTKIKMYYFDKNGRPIEGP